LICVNLGTGTAEEAASWVEYCNGETGTPMGASRARNGHDQPFNVKYWEIGNEMYGAWETGYAGLDGYLEGYRRFRSAMSTACPDIRFIANSAGAAWNQAVLQELGSLMDCLDVHIYPGISENAAKCGVSAVFEEMRLRISDAENEIARVRGEIETAGLAGNVKLGVCEYNISGGNWGPDRIYLSTHGNALFCAGVLIAFQKNADIVEICNISNLTNAWWASCIRTNARGAHATAPYHVLAMMSGLCGDRLFALSGDEAEGFRASASGGEGFVSVAMLNFSTASRDVSLDFTDCAGLDVRRAERTVLAAKPEIGRAHV
jgi:alpha-N-arabinofuranosidase